MRLAVIVTEEDIKDGVRSDPASCPVAIAATRAANIPMRMGFSLLHEDTDRTGRINWGYPDSTVVEWIRKFDEGEDVAPFGFEVDMRVMDA